MQSPRLGLAVLLTVLAAVPAAATTYWRNPEVTPGFGGVRKELQRLVNADGRRRVNHLCAVVEDVHEPPSASSEGNSQQLIVYWREGASIYTYGPGDHGSIGPGNRNEGADINLRMDVVKNERDIAGSTTRVTRAYVDSLITHCRTSGVSYTIVRNSR